MEKNKLQHPLFLLAIVLLVANDFIFKATFGNALTGKLSDFAGLFAFPFLFSCLLPQRKKTIHIFTAIAFVWWKSSFSQPFIDTINLAGIPLNRVVDFSDNMALTAIALSYFVFNKEYVPKAMKPILKYSIILVSCTAFAASGSTSHTMVRYTGVDKEYKFDMSLNDFIKNYNEVQKKEIERLSCRECNFGRYDKEKGVFFSKYNDTLAYLINPKKFNPKDTIRVRTTTSGAEYRVYEINEKMVGVKLINIETSVASGKVKKLKPISTTKGTRKFYYPIENYAVFAADTLKAGKIQKEAVKEFENNFVKQLK